MSESLHSKTPPDEEQHEKPVVVHDEELHDVDPAEVKRLVWKQDLMLVPLLWATYTVAFIDRSAIGNAKVLGFAKDNHLVGTQYSIGLSVFFVFYVAFQAPNNLMLKAVGAKRWLTFLIISFGIITISTAFCRSFGSFVTVRALLGMVEGGVISGFAQLLAQFYDRDEITSRAAWYLIAPSTSGAFGGLLAYGLAQIKPTAHLRRWSYIFVVEGCLSILLGLICIVVFPARGPESVWWLNDKQKALAVRRMQATVHSTKVEKTTMKLVRRAVNPLTVICGCAYICDSYIVQSLSIFLPQILNGLGYSALGSNLASVWPNLVGSFVFILIILASRRTGLRGVWCAFAFALSMIGFGMLLDTHSGKVNYGGTFVATMGAASIGPMLIGWAASNAAPFSTRAVAIAIPPSMGHLGAIASTWAYKPADEPHYLLGNGLNVGMCGAGIIFSLLAIAWVSYENRARARGKRDHRLQRPPDEVEELGSDHPAYRLKF